MKSIHSQSSAALALAINDALPAEEATVLRLRYGIGQETAAAYSLIAHALGLSEKQVREIEQRALRNLKRPGPTDLLRPWFDRHWEPLAKTVESKIEVGSLIAQVPVLNLELIEHLRRSADDLLSIQSDVFEQLVAELLASHGCDDVRWVGRNKKTAADVFAAWHMKPTGLKARYFVETKRWRDRVGVEVFNSVLGAMVTERPSLGWHGAMIVTANGFKETDRYSPGRLIAMGLDLKDKKDLTRWLTDYVPSEHGLWLPAGRKGVVPEV